MAFDVIWDICSKTEIMPVLSSRDEAQQAGDRLVAEHAGGDPFAAAFRHTRMPMIITDPRQPDNPIVFCNGAFLDLTLYKEEDVVGRNSRFLQGPQTERRTSQESHLQAQKMEAIGQLTAGMTHDFNNLLQVINGNLEVALISLEKPDLARAGRLTQQLLTFARKQRLEPKPVDINNLVVEFSEMLVRTLGGKVDLRLDLRPGLPLCHLTRRTWRWPC